MRFDEKRVMVTGANRSIGRAIALAFAKEGADVLISYHNDSHGAQQVVETCQGFGRKATAVHGDFSSIEGVHNFWLESTKFSPIYDVLVNCAGGYETTPFLDQEVSQYLHLFQVGPAAALQLSQYVARSMIEHKRPGSILNISSISGVRPYPNRISHASAKAALNMQTQCAALELAPHNIRVNAIAPGSTPYEEDPPPKDAKEIPLGRHGTPHDQASMSLYLASEEASWITGQVYVIDGGQTLSYA